MANPTPKHNAIEQVLNHITGDNRQQAIRGDRCIKPPIGCGGVVSGFRDSDSAREYTISGLCQKCQDELFGK